jgi:ABC-type multidrug transport system fused ATPase/permease subunit
VVCERRGVLGSRSRRHRRAHQSPERPSFTSSAGRLDDRVWRLSWALDGAAVRWRRCSDPICNAPEGNCDKDRRADGTPAHGIRLRDVTFTYPSAPRGPVLQHFDLTVPAGSSLAIVGQNGAGKTTIAKLLCRLYDPQAGVIEVDGVDIRAFDLASWRSRIAAVFQDFIRLELPLRDNVARGRARRGCRRARGRGAASLVRWTRSCS